MEFENKSKWNKRMVLENKKDEYRRLIDGALNRISITDDDSERDALAPAIEHYVQEYKKLSREAKILYNELNKELFEKHINDKNKPVLVDFWAPWCVYCRRIAPALNILADQYKDVLVIGKVNIDDEQELALQEQIEVIPTLIIYQGGKILASIVAPESKAQLEAFIKQALKL